jgi:VWFA-related protein
VGVILKRVFLLFLLLIVLMPIALFAMQESSPVTLELTGINTSNFPTVTLTANVYDRLGQPIFGLTQDNFAITGDLVDSATIINVENISDDNLPISIVLAIDTSSSMAGTPFEAAKAAAASFINLIGPNDAVAIVTFDTIEQLVQDFTADKETLLGTINSLSYGGKTALYDGSVLAIQTAANSGTPRRAVILLSDGAEYGGFSSTGRESALDEGVRLGVPVYTIGLGYGFDRSFLEQLSSGTLTNFSESPTPDQLLEIYNGLAAKLRSQYVITLNVDLPTDGSTYTLNLQATTDSGTGEASAELRAPVPVPIVSLGQLPGEPISEPTDITAQIVADDEITSAEFLIDGASVSTSTESPYTITVDPITLLPGSHELSFNATDATGDVGTTSATFEVSALPPVVNIVGLPDNEISEPQTVTLDITGQTLGASAAYAVDGGDTTAAEEAPFSFTIDPFQFSPGEHTLNVEVVNEGGGTATLSQPFTVATLPPTITISGLENGQTVNEPTEVTVSATGQTPINQITASLNGEELANETAAETAFTINPASIQPGNVQLSITTQSESGEASQTFDLVIPSLPPQITFSGIEAGETLDENRSVEITLNSQTDVTSVTYEIDGVEVGSQNTAPFSVELDVTTLPPGSHTLSAEATNAGGQSSTANIDFVVSEGPSLTLTALAPTHTPTATFTPTSTFTATPNLTTTGQARATLTATAQLVEMSTAQAASAADAQGTQNAQASLDASASAVAGVTSQDATNEALASATAVGTLNARETINAQATLAAQSALDAQATASADGSALTEEVTEATEVVVEQTETALTEEPTEVAQGAASPTGERTPEATSPPVNLNTETQSATQQNNLLPILCIVGAVVLLIVILFLVVGRQRRGNQS